MTEKEKITLEMIREQQQLVAELRHKKEVADKEYYRLTSLRHDASTVQNQADLKLANAEEALARIGKKFALDLSDTDYTPEITEIETGEQLYS